MKYVAIRTRTDRNVFAAARPPKHKVVSLILNFCASPDWVDERGLGKYISR